MTPSESVILTLPEDAAWLKVRPRQVDRLGVPCIRLGRKTVRFLKSDVVAWLESQRTRTESPRTRPYARRSHGGA